MSDNYNNSSDLSNYQPKKTLNESSLNISQAKKTRIESHPDKTARTPMVSKNSQAKKTIGDNNRYLLQTLLGEGGMSKVYRALDTKFETHVVAIKVMANYAAANGEYLVKRFTGEVKAIASLKHPNIIQILDFGITPNNAPFYGAPFYVMEYLPGKTLQNLLTENKRVPLNLLLKIISQVCVGLQEAHRKGIIHRDLKPDNIFLVTGSAWGEIVKIIDFGIAKNLNYDSRNNTQLTREGSFIGTYRYASPEQCRGLKTIDQRTDIYSLGVILYEAICGKNPYDLDDNLGSFEADWIACHIRVPPKPLKQQPGCEQIVPELENIVMKCLAKSPQDRFSDLGELQQALARSFSVKTEEKIISNKSNNAPQRPPLNPNKKNPHNEVNEVAEKSFPVAPKQQKTKRRKVLKYGSLILGGISLTALLTRILKQPQPQPQPQPPDEPIKQPLDESKFEIEPVKNTQITSSGEVWSLAISSDGKFIASGNNNGTIELFDRQTKDITTILGEHQNVIRALAFLPNSDRLISGDSDGNIKIWNRQNSNLEKRLQGHSASIWSLAISPDNQTLISSSADTSIGIWNLITGEKKGMIIASDTVIYTLAFSPDGRIFASGGKDNVIKIWDFQHGKLLKSLEGHQNTVRAIAISADGRYLVSGSWDKTIRVWELGSGELITTFEDHQDRVVTVAISNDSDTVFSGAIDKTIKVWSIKNNKLITTLSQHHDWVLALAISDPEKLLISGSKDRTMQLWQYKYMNNNN